MITVAVAPIIAATITPILVIYAASTSGGLVGPDGVTDASIWGAAVSTSPLTTGSRLSTGIVGWGEEVTEVSFTGVSGPELIASSGVDSTCAIASGVDVCVGEGSVVLVAVGEEIFVGVRVASTDVRGLAAAGKKEGRSRAMVRFASAP